MVLDGLADPEVAVTAVGCEATLVGVRTEVMMRTVGVSPARVAEGVMMMIDVWTSGAVGAAEEAVATWVSCGADDCAGAGLEAAGGLDEAAAGEFDEGGRLTGAALDAGVFCVDGAAEGSVLEGV